MDTTTTHSSLPGTRSRGPTTGEQQDHSYHWTDPLGVYVRLCDRLLEPGDNVDARQKLSRHVYMTHGESSTKRQVSVVVNVRRLDGELRLDATQLVKLAVAVAKGGMGRHPVMNAISNALGENLGQICTNTSIHTW